jgi:hypothetical protein
MATKEPIRIGLFVGREWSFPPAFIEEVNKRTADTNVIAEYVKIGGTIMDEPTQYRVIIDRISHEVPYYRSYLKNAAVQGVKVVNDPFMWTSDDKFFGASLLSKLGLHSPRTVALPNKEYVPGIKHDESLRNLTYPIDWGKLVDYVGGFPLILKDAHGGGWRDVYVIHSMEELWYQYNHSGLLTMIIQEFIKWDDGAYARCMCIGQEKVRVMRYDPSKRYYHPEHGFEPDMAQTLHDATLRVCQMFGYDMNTAEFAIRNGVPYAIDFMNPAPDMDVNSLGKVHFDWIVTTMADVMIDLAKGKTETSDNYKWGALIKASKKSPLAQASAPKKAATNKATSAKAEKPSPSGRNKKSV